MFTLAFIFVNKGSAESSAAFYHAIDHPFKTFEKCESFLLEAAKNFESITRAKVVHSFCTTYKDQEEFAMVLGTKEFFSQTFESALTKSPVGVFKPTVKTSVRKRLVFNVKTNLVEIKPATFTYLVNDEVVTPEFDVKECEAKLRSYVTFLYPNKTLFSYCARVDEKNPKSELGYIIQVVTSVGKI